MSTRSLFRKHVPAAEPERCSESLAEEGYCVLESVLTHAECDSITDSFEAYVGENPEESAKFVLATNRHSRLCNMHLVSAAARSAITKPRVLAALDTFLGGKAYVATSLFFEQSSEQFIHRDTPYFHTKPRLAFAGVWFALEDVHSDAGPLRYFPGGHRIEVAHHQATAEDEDEAKPAWSAAYCRYSDELLGKIQESGLSEKTALIRKGDCFIWHPELPHGASSITSPGKTRKSMVFHCAPESVTMYGPNEFFGLAPHVKRRTHLIPMTAKRNMMDTGKPVFANN